MEKGNKLREEEGIPSLELKRQDEASTWRNKTSFERN